MFNRKTTEQFVEEAKKIHGDKYDYSKVDYNGCFIHINVICKKHGIFTIKPTKHITRKQGCKKCGVENIRKIRSSNTD